MIDEEQPTTEPIELAGEPTVENLAPEPPEQPAEQPAPESQESTVQQPAEPTALVPASEPATDTVQEVAEPSLAEQLEASPVPVQPASTPEQPAPSADVSRSGVSWWPFLVYLGLWVLFAAVTAWQLLQVPSGAPVYESRVYPYTVLAGLVLTAAGPALILAVWLGSTSRGGRGGTFVTALGRGAIATVAGVTLWWLVLLGLDAVRLGRLF